MSIKFLPLGILLLITLATAIVLVVENDKSTTEKCTTNCDEPPLMKIVSLVAWFFAWEVGLIMLLHISLVCMSNEVGTFLPTVTSVILYCVATFIFFTGGFMLAGNRSHTPNANNSTITTPLNITDITDTNKEETVPTHRIRFIYHTAVLMAAIIGFTLYALLVCALMYAPRNDAENSNPPQNRNVCIIKAKCKTIQAIAKELGRKLEKPPNRQIEA